MTINELLISIDSGEYKIPEFQRGYVWRSKQVKSFFRSLYLGYPSGSFLIWKTSKPSKIRGGNVDDRNVHKLILDGQQRLTTIYTFFRGKTPEWYEGESLRTDLYFNLETEEFEYYTQKKMGNNVSWINVSEFLTKGGVNTLLQKIDDKELDEEESNYYLSKVTKLNKLSSIASYDYYIKEVTIIDLEKVVEIFNLVNKEGTTLNESDLALAIITSNWPEAKSNFRKGTVEFGKYNYNLDFRNYTRLLNIICVERGIYSQEIGKVSEEDLEEAWLNINKILSYLINILRDRAYIDSTDDINSNYVLYVLCYYLYKKGGKFESEEEADKAIYWLYVALLWGRFSGSSETKLEADIRLIKEEGTLDALIQEMHLFRGASLQLRVEDLALQGVRSRIYTLFYASIRAQDAKDWTNPALSLYSKSVGYNNQLQRHHIFPKSFLYTKYSGKNSIHKAMVNEIANIAFITQKSNMEIFVSDPREYLPKIDATQLRKQFVPTDEALYNLENFEEFLEKRRELLCKGINDFLSNYYNDANQNGIPDDLEHYDESIEEIEIALRNFISQRLEEFSEIDAYSEYIPGHLKNKTQETIEKWLLKNPGEDSKQFHSLRRRLDFFDLQHYYDIISSKECWSLFEDYFGKKPNLQLRFTQLCELRNGIRHSRGASEMAIKDGEAAIVFFNSILRPFMSNRNEKIEEE